MGASLTAEAERTCMNEAKKKDCVIVGLDYLSY